MNTSHRQLQSPAMVGVFMRMPNITLHRASKQWASLPLAARLTFISFGQLGWAHPPELLTRRSSGRLSNCLPVCLDVLSAGAA
jgi:hypothetical protein